MYLVEVEDTYGPFVKKTGDLKLFGFLRGFYAWSRDRNLQCHHTNSYDHYVRPLLGVVEKIQRNGSATPGAEIGPVLPFLGVQGNSVIGKQISQK